MPPVEPCGLNPLGSCVAPCEWPNPCQQDKCCGGMTACEDTCPWLGPGGESNLSTSQQASIKALIQERNEFKRQLANAPKDEKKAE